MDYNLMDVNKFISVVENSPATWNINSLEYKNSSERLGAWSDVANEFNINIAEAQGFFKSLREKYRREKKKEEQSCISGSSLHNKWVLMDSLKFLDTVYRKRKCYPAASPDSFLAKTPYIDSTSCDNIPSASDIKPPPFEFHTIDDSSSCSDASSISLQNNEKFNNKKYQNVANYLTKPDFSTKKDEPSPINVATVRPGRESANQWFGKYVGAELEELGYPYDMQAKTKINQILWECRARKIKKDNQ